MSRRSIIALVAVVVVALVGITALAVLVSGEDRRVGALQSLSPGETAWVLELNGQTMGYLESLDGCRAKGTVAETTQHGTQVVTKHLAGVEYEPCVLQFTSDMGRPLFQWLQASLEQSYQRKNLALRHVNYQRRAHTTIQVQNALISRLALPKLDASKTHGEEALFELTVEPDQLSRTEHGNSGPTVNVPPPWKTALMGRFQLSLAGAPGLDARVIEPLVASVKLEENTGETRIYVQQPTSLNVGPLQFTPTASSGEPLDDWFEDFVIEGDNDPSEEMAGTLELRDVQNTVLLTVNLTGVGIFDAVARPAPAGEAGASQASVPLKDYRFYVNGATLSIPANFGGASPPPPAPPPASPPPPAPTPPPTPPPTSPPPTPPPAEPLAAPERLTAKLNSASEASLEWAPVEGSETYLVLMSLEPGGEYAEVARSEKPTVVVGELKGGPPYYFVVRAVQGPTESENSEEAAAQG